MNLKGHLRAISGPLIGGLLVIGLLMLANGASQVAHADPGTQFVKVGGSGTLCAQAQPCDLQMALAQAISGDVIYVAGGTYTGSGGAVVTVTKNITLYGGWDGATTAPPIRDPAAYPTVLDGENQRRGVYVGIGGALTLDGFTVTRGHSGCCCGGIAADLASLTVRNCQITGNSTSGDGGGVFVNGGTAQILSNRIVSNTATWTGGLRIANDADVTVIGNEIRYNVAQVASGGIEVGCCGGSAPLIARNLIADNNGGYRGGGVRVNETHAQLVNGCTHPQHRGPQPGHHRGRRMAGGPGFLPCGRYADPQHAGRRSEWRRGDVGGGLRHGHAGEQHPRQPHHRHHEHGARQQHHLSRSQPILECG